MSFRYSLSAAVLTLLVAASLVACGPETEPETASEEATSEASEELEGGLRPLPEIEAARVSEEAGEHLARARSQVEELRRAGADDADLAAAYGRLGETAHAYDFPELALVAYANAETLDPAAGEWSYLRGVILEESGRPREAISAFTARVEAWPEDWAARLRLAEAHRDLGEAAESARIFRHVLENGPPETAAAAHYGLGRLAATAGRHAEAVEHLSAALERQPDAASLHSLLAAAHRRLGDRETAEHHARRFGAGQVEFADPLLRRVESRLGGAGVHIEQAFLAAQDDRFGEAVSHYLEALETEPGNLTALRGIARSYHHLGRLEESLRSYENLLDLAPDDAVGRAERATVLMEMGRHDESIAAFRELLAAEPEFVEALLNLGIAYLREERWDDAVDALERALALDPGSPDALYRLALARQGQERVDDAVAILRRLVRDTPTHVPGRQLLGRLLEGRGDLDGALEQYRAVVGFEGVPAPEAALAHYEIARILSLKDQATEAEEAARRALDLLPELQPARFALGNFLRRRGALDEAVEAYRRVAEADPKNVTARERELETLMLAGRFAAAAERVERYLEQHPRSAQLGHHKARLLALGPPGVGDPAAALDLATAIFQAHQSLEHAETLVMALAAAGRFDEALPRQEELVRRAEASGRSDLLPRLRANLERYRARRPPELSP